LKNGPIQKTYRYGKGIFRYSENSKIYATIKGELPSLKYLKKIELLKTKTFYFE